MHGIFSSYFKFPSESAKMLPASVVSTSLFYGFTLAAFLGATTCPANSPLSCSSSSVSNTCCTNSPGGLLVQTQFWDTNPSTGPDDSWTIHGLWPDNCDGTYKSTCDSKRAYKNITDVLNEYGETDLLNYMQTYWVDINGENEQFWEHEWSKHGTCISTLNPSCYTDYKPQEELVDFLNTVVNLFKNLDTYQFLSDAGITPSSSKKYSLSDVQDALSSAFGSDVYVDCDGDELNQAWYFYHTQGNIQSGKFIPTNPAGAKSGCPSEVSYSPKSGGTSSGRPSPAASSSIPPEASSSEAATCDSEFYDCEGDKHYKKHVIY